MDAHMHDNLFMASPELLKLLLWLIDYEQEGLKKLIQKALKHGLDEQLLQEGLNKDLTPELLQQTVIDLLMLLETLMNQTSDEENVHGKMQRALIPALRHIDPTQHDRAAFDISVAKATDAITNNKMGHSKEILCKELLKRWRPQTKKPLSH